MSTLFKEECNSKESEDPPRWQNPVFFRSSPIVDEDDDSKL